MRTRSIRAQGASNTDSGTHAAMEDEEAYEAAVNNEDKMGDARKSKRKTNVKKATGLSKSRGKKQTPTQRTPPRPVVVDLTAEKTNADIATVKMPVKKGKKTGRNSTKSLSNTARKLADEYETIEIDEEMAKVRSEFNALVRRKRTILKKHKNKTADTGEVTRPIKKKKLNKNKRKHEPQSLTRTMSNASEEDNGEAKGSDNDANDNTNQAVGKITGGQLWAAQEDNQRIGGIVARIETLSYSQKGVAYGDMNDGEKMLGFVMYTDFIFSNDTEVQCGMSYQFDNIRVKTYNENYNPTATKKPYTQQIVVDANSKIFQCEEPPGMLPHEKIEATISDLETKENKSIVSLYGVILEINEIRDKPTHNGGTTTLRRINLGDDSNAGVTCAIWGEDKAKPLKLQVGDVVYMRNAKVSDFDKLSLSISAHNVKDMEALTNIDTTEERMSELKTWYDGYEFLEEFKFLSNNVQVKGGQMKSTALDFYEANKNLYKTDAELKMAYDAYKKANCDA